MSLREEFQLLQRGRLMESLAWVDDELPSAGYDANDERHGEMLELFWYAYVCADSTSEEDIKKSMQRIIDQHNAEYNFAGRLLKKLVRWSVDMDYSPDEVMQLALHLTPENKAQLEQERADYRSQGLTNFWDVAYHADRIDQQPQEPILV